MNITITNEAVKWFESELLLDKGDAIHFYGKAYGKTEVHTGFSIGMNVEQPGKSVIGKTEINGITYYASEEDNWFFSGYDLEVDYDKERDEPVYHFHKNK